MSYGKNIEHCHKISVLFTVTDSNAATKTQH